ncbi:MAG: NTP transferase domain-containing protein, partial [Alphaproteobacteria bacterium]|nr:NTP transferase domain-containing protein [Alphaproteobacteria bacterium]
MRTVTPVILAAGLGVRFGGDVPKCLATVDGRPLLAHAFRALKAAGFESVHLVVGYKADVIEAWLNASPAPVAVSLVRNPDYARRSIHSFHCAARVVQGPILLIEGDLLYGPQIIKDLCADERPDLVPCGPIRQPRPWLIERGP